MKRRWMTLALALALPTFGAGCFTVQHRYTGEKPLTNGAGLTRPTKIVKHFSEHDRQFFWIHGGIPTGEPLNGLALAAKQADGHAGVVNLKLKDGQDVVDAVVTHGLCILSLVCGTWSTWVEGDVVDYVDAHASR